MKYLLIILLLSIFIIYNIYNIDFFPSSTDKIQLSDNTDPIEYYLNEFKSTDILFNEIPDSLYYDMEYLTEKIANIPNNNIKEQILDWKNNLTHTYLYLNNSYLFYSQDSLVISNLLNYKKLINNNIINTFPNLDISDPNIFSINYNYNYSNVEIIAQYINNNITILHYPGKYDENLNLRILDLYNSVKKTLKHDYYCYMKEIIGDER